MVNFTVKVNRKRPWMETKPSFSLHPILKQQPPGAEAAVKSGFKCLMWSFKYVIGDYLTNAPQQIFSVPFSKTINHSHKEQQVILSWQYMYSLQCLFEVFVCAVGDVQNEEADSRQCKGYGRAQNLFQSRKAVQTPGISKHCSSTRTQLSKNHKNLRETLVKFVW